MPYTQNKRSGTHDMKGDTKSTHQQGTCTCEDDQLYLHSRKHTAASNVLRQIGTACGTTEEEYEHNDVV